MAKKTKAKAKASAKKAVKKPAKKPAAAAKSKASAPKAKASIKPKMPVSNHVAPKPIKPDMTPAPLKNKAFIKRQKARLLDLRDHILDQMQGVAQDNLRSRAEGSEASAFGMHQADAGSDAYEKDFALSLLSQEQDALYEIEEALKRVDTGAYGICEMSGKPIPNARLEAIPFARFTVECQAQIERENRGRRRWDTAPQFMDSADSFVDEEDEPAEEDDKKKEKE